MGGGKGGNINNNSIPSSSIKMVLSLKEIVNYPEVEIYAMLKECNMDPNEAVHRLVSQDPFREVKSKREKKKEHKDVNDSRSRVTTSSSTRGSRGGLDRYSGRSSTTQFGPYDSGASRGKPAVKRDNGTTAYTSATIDMAGNNLSRRQFPVSDSTMDKSFPSFATDNVTTAPPGLQSAWAGMPGQVSMADIVKMGRPHGKASSSMSTSQQQVNNQCANTPPGVPGPHDLAPSQNYPSKFSEMNPQSRITGNQPVLPNDDWPLDEEPQVPSASSIMEPSVDSEPHADHYDRAQQQYISPSDEVRYVEDDNDDGGRSSFVVSAPGSNENVQDDYSGSAPGVDNDTYQNINSYQVHHQEVEDASATVSSMTANFQKLSLPEEDEDPSSEDDGPAVKIPDHLRVQSADCSHLSFGSFGSGLIAPFSGSVASGHVISTDEEAPVGVDAPSVGHPEVRNSEYYENEHLNSAAEGNDAHRIGAESGNFDTSSVSQPDMSQRDILKQDAPEVAQENQYSFPSSTANYAFDSSQQLNASFALPQTSSQSQMQGLPSFSGVMPYSNSLPSALLPSNVQHLRESELAYSPFPISQSMPTKYNSSVSSISASTASMAEAMKMGNFSATQSTQTLQGSSVTGGHAIPQMLHPYSQHSLPLGPFPTSLVNFPFVPQNYPYMPSAFQQAFAAGNSNYPQSLATVLPQYKNSVSVTSLPQSAAVASGYGAAFGNSNSIPNNFPLNPPGTPAGTSMNYDDVLSSQYKDASHLLSLQQGPGSRTMSGVPGSTYYSFQGQSQQPAGFRQNQQPSQHYGALSGYPNYYHSQGGPSLEQQLQMSRDVSLGGSQGQQPKQTSQQLWQNGY